MWGDKWSNILKLASSLVQALVVGSLFYNLPNDSTSTFTRPGSLYFPILYYAVTALSETTAAFIGRPIINRHKDFGFHRPSAYALACVVADIPIVILNITVFDIVFYFMVGYQRDAGKFFTNWIILVAYLLCFNSFYRMIGAACKTFGVASQIAGFLVTVTMVYTGKSLHQRSSASHALQLTFAKRLLHSPQETTPVVPLDIVHQSGRVRLRGCHGRRVRWP